MANKTIDRRKAGSARSQAAKAAKPKPARPGAGKGTSQSSLKLDKPARSSQTETLEIEASETDELALDEEAETDEAENEAVDEGDEEEAEEAEEQPAKRRFAKKERTRDRDLVELAPQDYSVSRPAGSRLPNNGAVRFVRSAYRELRLVTWPTRRDTWNWSLVVVGVCVATAILLGAADLGLSRFVTCWISLGQ